MLMDFSLTLLPEFDKIAVMKNFFRLFLLLLLIISTVACASNQVDALEEQTETISQNNSDTNIEKKQNQKKLLFEDWKYKGFGQALPDWFEAAYKGNLGEVRKRITISKGYKIELVTAQGINSDQINKRLWQLLSVKEEVFELYDSCWGRLNSKEASGKNNGYPYFAAAVLLIKNKDNKE